MHRGCKGKTTYENLQTISMNRDIGFTSVTQGFAGLLHVHKRGRVVGEREIEEHKERLVG